MRFVDMPRGVDESPGGADEFVRSPLLLRCQMFDVLGQNDEVLFVIGCHVDPFVGVQDWFVAVRGEPSGSAGASGIGAFSTAVRALGPADAGAGADGGVGAGPDNGGVPGVAKGVADAGARGAEGGVIEGRTGTQEWRIEWGERCVLIDPSIGVEEGRQLLDDTGLQDAKAQSDNEFPFVTLSGVIGRSGR